MTNVVLLVMDDVGVENFAPWGRGGAGTYGYPTTTAIDAICSAGVRFNRCYVEQLCSPTRAAIATARHPFRTGVGDIIRDDSDGPTSQACLPESEWTIAKILKANGYATACFGKWHLGNTNAGGRLHPNRMGFDVFAGNMFNLSNTSTHSVEGVSFREGYYCYDETFQGQSRITRAFHTTHMTNLALRWVRDQGSTPFFLYMPYFGVHAPFVNRTNLTPNAINTPPTALYDAATWTHGADADQTTTQQQMHAWRAGVEATSAEIGRLLAALPADTIVIFLTDNGSPSSTLANEVHPTLGAYDGNHGKDSPYEPGIWSAMAWKGPGIAVGTYDKIVSAVDVLPSLLDLLGLDHPDPNVTLDGVSFVDVLTGLDTVTGVREFAYSEWFQPNGPNTSDAVRTAGEWALIGDVGGSGAGHYKILKNGLTGTIELYDLIPSGSYDPMEATNLTPGGVLSGLTPTELAFYNAAIAYRAGLLAS